jgi:sterol desaturase/sphingolipid hydroxylase (fatty acid hydroxylase superfamily)
VLIKFGAVVALGPPALGVLVFEVLLNATSMFNHGNVASLSARSLSAMALSHADMHRVHHSIVVNETNSSFGQPAVVGPAIGNLS